MTEKTIGIIGGGAWGTALAQVQATSGRKAVLWAREAPVVDAINNKRENTPFLPGVALHKNIFATLDLAEAAQADVLLLVTPAQHTRSVLSAIGPANLENKTLVLCAKGIEIETGALLSKVVQETAPQSRLAILTGPTFAREIAMGLPAAVTIAASDLASARLLSNNLGSRVFRPYASDDMTGAELGGAIKNVLAIACGIVAGRKMGDSARAAILTRGMAEMMRIALALGGRRETLMGMCGVGDLVLTATSLQSRNFSLGFAMGEGQTSAEILATRTAVTEGVHTARAARALTRRLGVDAPIMDTVYALLHEGLGLGSAIENLLDRPFGDEGL